jgi:hypothetical protein
MEAAHTRLMQSASTVHCLPLLQGAQLAPPQSVSTSPLP